MAQESWNCDTAEGSGCQQQEGLVKCTNNCGFFGCAATMNLCSQCFRDLCMKKQGSPSFTANASEKVVAAMATSAEKSRICSSEKALIPTMPTEKSAMSPTYMPMTSVAGSEKTLAALPSPAMVQTSADAVELVLPLASSSRPPAQIGPSHVPTTTDLAPIAALFASNSPDVQVASRSRSTNKCLTCKKRLGLLGFKCRCGNVFCATHRYSDKHACPFDYKTAGREAIAKANPVVKAQKVERI